MAHQHYADCDKGGVVPDASGHDAELSAGRQRGELLDFQVHEGARVRAQQVQPNALHLDAFPAARAGANIERCTVSVHTRAFALAWTRATGIPVHAYTMAATACPSSCTIAHMKSAAKQ